ncbi:hypothetical protein AAZF84_22465 [Bacillus sp. JR_15]
MTALNFRSSTVATRAVAALVVWLADLARSAVKSLKGANFAALVA